MKISTQNLLLSTICLFLNAISTPTMAGLASPDILEIEQSGIGIKLINKGDEYQGWTETINGYTVLKTPSGIFEYAQKDANGNLTPSGIPISPPREALSPGAPESLPFEKGLRPPRRLDIEQQNIARRNQIRPNLSKQDPINGPWTPYPVSGTRKLLIILVGFSDRPLVTTPNDWYSTIFDTTTNAKSVVNYYKENSFNNLIISPAEHTQVGSPAGVVKVTLPQTHPNCGQSCSYPTENP